MPILGERCDICGKRGKDLYFHDLGDIRPAMKEEREKLEKLIPFKEVRSYLKKRLILVAKQPGLDYRKDVYVDGFKIGIMEYIKDEKWRWRFIPTGKGANLFYHLTLYEDFKIDVGGYLKGKKIKKKLEKEWAIFRKENCIGIAVNRGDFIKIHDVFCRKTVPKKASTLETAVEANRKTLSSMERKAVEYLIKKSPDYVAFSGGKDSEVSLYLASLAGVKKAVFVNTGFEFPETERFVRRFSDYIGVDLVELKPKDDFWKIAMKSGIPTKDNRWCTKYLKINPLKSLSGTIVDGMRKYESMRRMHAPETRKLGNLRTIYPIFDWLALQVWLYIYYHNLPYNPLYDMGYERLGCYMCPSMLNAEFHNLKRTHPQLFKRWYDYLRERGFSKDDIMDGRWRWKILPPKMREI